VRLSILGTDYDHIPDMIQEDNPEEGNSLDCNMDVLEDLQVLLEVQVDPLEAHLVNQLEDHLEAHLQVVQLDDHLVAHGEDQLVVREEDHVVGHLVPHVENHLVVHVEVLHEDLQACQEDDEMMEAALELLEML